MMSLNEVIDIQPLMLVFTFVFGAIIGSFLNVVVYRYNTGKGVRGRSKCMTCGHRLSWMELIPIISFFALRGACRKCKSKISWQYPLVEIVAGLIYVGIIMVFPPVTPESAVLTALHLIIASILLVITVYDMRHKIIPDSMSYAVAGLAFITLFISPVVSPVSGFAISLWTVPTVPALLAGPFLALPFALIWLFSSGRWMGLGDAKLMLGLGWLTGVYGGMSAMVWAFWIGAVASVFWLWYVYGSLKAKYEIPFGPYLILGAYLVILFGLNPVDFVSGVYSYLQSLVFLAFY